MSETSGLVMIWTTVSHAEQARDMARSLVEGSLAACVQIEPSIVSIYSWDDQLQTESEARLIIKTTIQRRQSVVDFLTNHHPYDEPEILVTEVLEASPGYCTWVHNKVDSSP